MITWRDLDAKYGGQRQVYIAFLNGKLTPEEEHEFPFIANINMLLAVALQQFGGPLIEELRRAGKARENPG
jgi:hypothetical protein